METAAPSAQQPVKIQCPYTASSCPLFNPTFSVEDVLGPDSPRPKPASPFPPPHDEPRRPSLVDSMRNDRVIGSTSSSSGYQSTPPGPGEAVSFFYTDFSIAPAPVSPAADLAKYSISSQPSQPSMPAVPRSSALPLPGSLNMPHSPSSATSALGSAILMSSLGTSSYPSPGKLISTAQRGAEYSYERRRKSFEDEALEATAAFGSSAVADATAAMSVGATSVPDASIAYELAGLASAGGGGGSGGSLFGASAAKRRASYNGLVMPLGPSTTATGDLLVGGSTPSSSSGYVLPPLPTLPAENSPATLDELDDIEEDDGDDGDEDDDADGDYVEGERQKRRKTPSGSGSGAGGHDGKSTITSKHVVPHVPIDSITPFISKLNHLLSNPVYSDVIRWSGDGKSVIYVHTSQRLLDTLSRFFRHSNLHSFSRQMNIYGFQRLPITSLLSVLDSSPPSPLAGAPAVTAASEYSGFTHPFFFRPLPGTEACDLSRMKPQGPKTEQGRRNLAKKMAEGGKKKRGKTSGREGDKVGGVRKQGVKE
ncbi:hypothetical protein JCM8097_003020 [Rhodosporidiobolus ruineniae]